MTTIELSKKQQELIDKQAWKKKFTFDVPLSKLYRAALVRLHIYPTAMISQKPTFDAEETFNRAVLHQMIEELPREDLRAVEELVRVLVLYPEDVEDAVQFCQRENERNHEFLKKRFPEIGGVLHANVLEE